MFGDTPAYGFFIRHVRGLTMTDIETSVIKDDVRPAFVLTDVKGVDFHRIKAQTTGGAKTFVLKDVSDFNMNSVWHLLDTHLDQVKDKGY